MCWRLLPAPAAARCARTRAAQRLRMRTKSRTAGSPPWALELYGARALTPRWRSLHVPGVANGGRPASTAAHELSPTPCDRCDRATLERRRVAGARRLAVGGGFENWPGRRVHAVGWVVLCALGCGLAARPLGTVLEQILDPVRSCRAVARCVRAFSWTWFPASVGIRVSETSSTITQTIRRTAFPTLLPKDAPDCNSKGGGASDQDPRMFCCLILFSES
jgi:hypothetical protein